MDADLPIAGAHHRQLARLAGSWAGEETIHPTPGGAGGKSIGRLSSRMDLDGLFLITEYTQERDGRVIFRGHGVYGWDPSRDRYTMTWCDTMTAGSPIFVLGVIEGDTLSFSSHGPERHVRYIYRFATETRMHFRIEASRDDGSWAPLLEADYRRSEVQ